ADAAATGCSWRRASRSTRSTSIPKAPPAAEGYYLSCPGLARASMAVFSLASWMAGPSPAMNEWKGAYRLFGGHGVADPLVGIAPDRFDVLALDADQPGRSGAPRRMQVALVIDIGVARGELVVADRARLAEDPFARRRHLLVIGHDRLAEGLAVDRPGRPVIVRLAFLRALIDMAENAEAELG